MSNGWYQLENSKKKKTMPYGAEIQYGSMYRRDRPAPAAPAVSRNTEPGVCPEPDRPEPEPAIPAAEGTLPAAPVRACAEERRPDVYRDEGAVIHTQTVGPRGPAVLQDGILHETLDDFVTSKIVERAVHVKGWGAFGSFECQAPMGEFTMLPFLQRAGQCTAAASRFSLAVSNKGTPDTSRNVRGFSTKFYTDTGVFDLLCNHIPVFSVRDAIRFPESIQAFLPSPANNLIDPERFWNFVARAPESIHFVTWLYSDIGTVKSLRHLRSYGVNTYVWKNAAGVRHLVKYHWIPLAGAQFIDAQEAARLAGQDPDLAGRELYDTIAAGTPVEFELRVQLMDPCDADILPFDPLDDTKIWDEERYPLIPAGKLTLDRNPDNYMEQIEKLAFSPANLLPGAELSDDKMLQGRSFVYWDAQRHRLGPDFRKIGVNRQADWKPGDLVSTGLGIEACGIQVREDIPKQDDFAQAGERYRAFTPEERDHLSENIASGLRGVSEDVRRTVLSYLWQADEEYGSQVAQKIDDCGREK